MKNNENIKNKLNLARIFGFFMNYHRKEKGWSLENMGNELFLSYSTIRRIENGELLPEKNERDHIAKLFGYDLFLDNEFQIEEYDRQISIVRQEQSFRNNQRLFEKIRSFLNVKTLKANVIKLDGSSNLTYDILVKLSFRSNETRSFLFFRRTTKRQFFLLKKIAICPICDVKYHCF